MKRYKYPSTPHLPWSKAVTPDDIVLENVDKFAGKEIVVTEKRDGENTTMYNDHIHARSLDSLDHPSRHFVKGIWASIRHQLFDGQRICGENLFAKHSIFYENLRAYFEVFSIWYEDTSLAWDDVVEVSERLGLVTVPVLFRGTFEDFLDTSLSLNFDKQEGYVVRLAGSIKYADFADSMGKFVRKGHVQTDDHWLNQPMIPNKVGVWHKP